MHIDLATAFLYSLNPKGIRFGLENTRLVLEKLGRPQDAYQAVHLAGSNGKGSTAAFLEALTRRTGLRVGLYTSPHLSRFQERFRVDGQAVGDAQIGEMTDRLLADGLDVDPPEVLAWLEREDVVRRMASDSWYTERGYGSDFCRLTFFECTTILALLLFEQAGVELAILETGMGGRLDATNVIVPRVSVITPIHLEHTAWLGDTLSAIAGEKAGIIKPGVPLVCARQHPDAREVIARVAREQASQVSWLGEDFAADGDWHCARFRIGQRRLGPVRLGLAGRHQVDNAALALACLPLMGTAAAELADDDLLAGLQAVNWPGRFERFGRAGEWILDGAHNPDGIRALAGTVRQVLAGRPVRLLFGVLGDKDAGPMIAALAELAAEVHLVRPRDARGRDPRELVGLLDFPVQIHASIGAALDLLSGGTGGPVLVTGSLTVVGEARDWLVEHGLAPTPIPDARR